MSCINTDHCAGCPLDGQYRPVDIMGPEDARFLVITDVPSQAAARERRLLPTRQLNTFAESMEDIGLGKDDFRFIPACLCAYDPDTLRTKEKTAIHKHCRIHIVEEIAALKPEAVLTIGAPAASQAVGRSTKINSVRGQPKELEEFGVPMFALQSLAQVVNYPQNLPIYQADVKSFGRFLDADMDVTQSTAVEFGDYQIIDDLQFLIDADPEILSFDTENTGLRWYQQGCDVRNYTEARKGDPTFTPRFQILTMQFSIEPGKAFLLPWDHPEAPQSEARKVVLRNQLRRLMCKPGRIVVGQNAKYDNVALWMTEGIRYRIGGCTLMLAALDDENLLQKDLDTLTKIHVPRMAGYADAFNHSVDKSRMWEVPLADLRGYGAGDADAALCVYHEIEARVMEDEKLWAHYCHVSVPGLNALASMETEGMYIDTDKQLPEFQAFMEVEVARQYQSLLSQVPRSIKREHLASPKMKNKAAEDILSFSRGDFTKDILFKHKDGFRLTPKVFTKGTTKLKVRDEEKEPSTSSKDHLPYFFETCPFTMELAEYVKDERLLSTNVIGFNKKYVVGGKVRPVYWLSKTVTGRTSSDDPNGQNYPKRSKKSKQYRKMFKAPPGYYICELDLSQAELRIAACMANEPTMIQIYKDGGDIHRSTALIVKGVSEAQFALLPKAEQKDGRQKAKAVNFGFLYGMGWRKFIVYAKTQYNAVFTEDEAKRVREGFFKKYRGLEPWHKKMREFARRYKYVRSFSGRVRHLPMVDSPEEWIQQEAERQGINSPVQEFGSALGVMALGRMNEELDSAYLKIVGFIHDAIVFYVKKEYVEWGMRTVKGYMQSNPVEAWFGVRLQVPIIADCGFGENLGDIHECEGFTLDQPFNFDSLRDENGVLQITVPRQKIPPNNGRLTRSAYTLDTDMEEAQAVIRRVSRRGPAPAPVSETAPTVKRILRRKSETV